MDALQVRVVQGGTVTHAVPVASTEVRDMGNGLYYVRRRALCGVQGGSMRLLRATVLPDDAPPSLRGVTVTTDRGTRVTLRRWPLGMSNRCPACSKLRIRDEVRSWPA